LAALATVLVAFISKAAEDAAVSPSVILSIATLSSFTTALLFYFAYSEFLKPKHILGMLSIVAGVLLTAFSKDFVEDGTGSSNVMIVPISLAVLQSVVLTLATYMARESHNRGYVSL
jgi:drug/metabolite transporter (DMT)-like permease